MHWILQKEAGSCSPRHKCVGECQSLIWDKLYALFFFSESEGPGIPSGQSFLAEGVLSLKRARTLVLLQPLDFGGDMLGTAFVVPIGVMWTSILGLSVIHLNIIILMGFTRAAYRSRGEGFFKECPHI